jgi:hypothetical protein
MTAAVPLWWSGLRSFAAWTARGRQNASPASDAWLSWGMNSGALKLITYKMAFMSCGPGEGV